MEKENIWEFNYISKTETKHEIKLKQFTAKSDSSEIYLEHFPGRKPIESLVPREKSRPSLPWDSASFSNNFEFNLSVMLMKKTMCSSQAPPNTLLIICLNVKTYLATHLSMCFLMYVISPQKKPRKMNRSDHGDIQFKTNKLLRFCGISIYV